MSLSFNFSFGRLLGATEKLTPAKFNAIVKGIIGTLTGAVDASQIGAGAVTAAATSVDAYFYSQGTLSGATYTAAYTPPIGAYVDGMLLTFKAGSANPGAVNLDAGAGAKPLRKHAGLPLEAGDIFAGQDLELRYNSTLVAGGCFEVTSLLGQAEASTAPIVGSSRNLFARNSVATPASLVTLTADEIVLKNASGSPFLASAVTLTLDITASGANGLDTGVEAISKWYYVWTIYNPTTATVAGLYSLSSTAPTLPAGYTFKALVGLVRNDASGNFIPFYQFDRTFFTAELDVFTATAGHTFWQLTTVAASVPPIAKRMRGNMGTSTSNAGSIAVTSDGAVPADIAGSSTGGGTIGVCRAQFGNSAIAAMGSFVNAVPFEIQAQTFSGTMGLHTWMGNGSAIYALSITGYTI